MLYVYRFGWIGGQIKCKFLDSNGLWEMCVCARVFGPCHLHTFRKMCEFPILFDTMLSMFRHLPPPNSFTPCFYDNSHFQRPPATATRSTRMVSATGLTHSPIHFDVLWCLNEKQRIVAFSISMKMQLCHLGNGCVVCDSHLMWWRGEHTKETRNALIHSLALTKSHISHTRLVQIRVFGIASHSCTGVCVCVSAGNNVCLVAFVSQCN